MSLIDDALRRAQAAQGNGTEAAGLRVPLPLPDPGRARRRRLRRLAAILAVAAVAIAGGFLFLRRVEAPPIEPRAAAPSPRAALASAAMVTPTAIAVEAPRVAAIRDTPARASERRTTPASAPKAEPAAAPAMAAAGATIHPTAASVLTRAPAAVVAAAPPPPTRPPPRRQPPVVPQSPPPAEISYASGSPRIAVPEGVPAPAPAEAPPTPAHRPEPTREPAMRTRTFNGAANLPLARLELEGIVFSDTNPTALISGHVVRPGSYVEGYTVLSIGRDRVELQGDNERIVLILH